MLLGRGAYIGRALDEASRAERSAPNASSDDSRRGLLYLHTPQRALTATGVDESLDGFAGQVRPET